MCLVAINQIRMVKSNHLAPWCGGGFGMFSSNTSPESRAVVCFGYDESGQKHRILLDLDQLDSVKWPKNFLYELHSNPSEEMLKKIAKALLQKNFVKRLNFKKHSAGLVLGWKIDEPIYTPIKNDLFKLQNESVFTFNTIETAVYELNYNAMENSVKFSQLLNYQETLE